MNKKNKEDFKPVNIWSLDLVKLRDYICFNIGATIEQIWNRNIENALQRELNFYNKIFSRIPKILHPTKINVLLFDIDETIAQSIDQIDYVRPIFLKLVKDLKIKYPNIIFWILSWRWKNNILNQITQWSLTHIWDIFSKDYIFSSREHNSEDFENTVFTPSSKSYNLWYPQKANALHQLQSNFSAANFILIDDAIDEKLEELWMGIVIGKDDFFAHGEVIGVKNNPK